MHIRFDGRLRFAVISFAAAFAVIMALFICKPHIVRSRNRYVRAAFLFALAFVPGVLAASVCAKTITAVWEKAFGDDPPEITMEAEEDGEDDDDEHRSAV